MPRFKLQKKYKSPRRVEVRPVQTEIHVPALILCALLAFLIWLYVVGFSHLSDPPVTEETPPPAAETAEPTEAALSSVKTDGSYVR